MALSTPIFHSTHANFKQMSLQIVKMKTALLQYALIMNLARLRIQIPQTLHHLAD